MVGHRSSGLLFVSAVVIVDDVKQCMCHNNYKMLSYRRETALQGAL